MDSQITVPDGLKHGDTIPIDDWEAVQIGDLQICRDGDTIYGPIHSRISYESHTLYDGEFVYYTNFGNNIRLMIGSSHPTKNLRADDFNLGITIDRLERYLRQSPYMSTITHFQGSMYLDCNHATFRMTPTNDGVRILVYTDFVRPGHHHWDVCDIEVDAFRDYINEREEDYMARRRVFTSTFLSKARTLSTLQLLNHKFILPECLDYELLSMLLETLST